MEHKGVYPDTEIAALIQRNAIVSADAAILDSQIQPSSLDVRVGGHFYCLPYSVVPPRGVDLESYFSRIAKYDFEISGNAVGFLHKKNVYVVKLQESLSLPAFVCAKANAKSSIGRVDLHVRLITKDGSGFDAVSSGYTGELWLELYPRSFDIELSVGTTLNQIMFMDVGTQPLTNDVLVFLNRESGLVFDAKGIRCPDDMITDIVSKNVVLMTVNVHAGVVGYVARQDAPPVNLNRRDLPASFYFDTVRSQDGAFIVNPDSFYILSSHEIINIPAGVCAEMVDIETGFGEYRGHYAGFIDPGFRAPVVLELRNYGQPFVLRDGQVVSALKYFKMRSLPRVLYGDATRKSSYQGQSLFRLAKYFDMER